MPFQATRLETDEDVRRALQADGPDATLAPTAALAGHSAPAEDAPLPFRPTLRPPTALLTVQDDGAEVGQIVRIRTPQFVIGRAEGDFVIPHDNQMSSRHAEIRQTMVKDKLRWTLVDLGSTNGTFVRVGHAVLEHGFEFVLGRTRFRFENQPTEDPTTNNSPNNLPSGSPNRGRQATQGWQSAAVSDRAPAIIELSNRGPGRRILLSEPEAWLGKDPSRCQLVVGADPFVSARHARIRCDEEGRWILENNKSVNGVWLRVEQIGFKDSCRFMLGEQQFLVRLPS